MDPATIAIIVQFAIKYGPDAAEALVALFHKTTPPTQEEWTALFAKAREHTYDDYVNPQPPPAG